MTPAAGARTAAPTPGIGRAFLPMDVAVGGNALRSCPMRAGHLLPECPLFVGSRLTDKSRNSSRVSRFSLEREGDATAT